MKWTVNEVSTHRADIINVHYPDRRGHGEEIVLSLVEHDSIISIYVYPHEVVDNGEALLDDKQVDHLMHSTKFDKPLFKMLVDTLSLHADVALMMSLTYG